MGGEGVEQGAESVGSSREGLSLPWPTFASLHLPLKRLAHCHTTCSLHFFGSYQPVTKKQAHLGQQCDTHFWDLGAQGFIGTLRRMRYT